jgi:hypothetical protein
MATSEFDKLLAATNAKSATGSRLPDFTRLMAEVLKLSRTPKAAQPVASSPLRMAQAKTVEPLLTTLTGLLTTTPVTQDAPSALPVANGDLGELAAQVSELRRAIIPAATPVAVNTKSSTSSTAASSGSNGIVKFISTFLGGSGLGSIVSEIAGLFGGGKPDTPEPLYRFTLPQSVSVEAGLTRSREFVPVSYSQNGQARPTTQQEPMPQAAAQTLSVDSRWFMDHSEDIASAVKEAMLHSHSINDVVADL